MTSQRLGQAVLAVLAGESCEVAADRFQYPEPDLRNAAELYRTAGEAALLRLAERAAWLQVTLTSTCQDTTGPGLSRTALARLATELSKAEDDYVIDGYHFLYKEGGLRLRVRPNNEAAEHRLTSILNNLTAASQISGWTRGIYEPEEYAFGGPAAMEVAHTLFCADSRIALTTAGAVPTPYRPGRRELAVLLASAFLRAAGLDWYEQGAVWALVAEHRPAPPSPPPGQVVDARSAMRRLMTTVPPAHRAGAYWTARLAAFEAAGRRLAHLARAGQLQRGLRAVLAHHLIFSFNRAGLPAGQQAVLSYLAKEVIMNEPAIPTSEDDKSIAAQAEAPADAEDQAIRLRAHLVAGLRERGVIHSSRIADAIAAIPRHKFVPGVPLVDAYADAAIYTKHDRSSGQAISAASQPTIVAMMLEQLDAQPGDNVLEAGAGTGYNAALIGHLVGPQGNVITLDVDHDLIANVQANLQSAGIGNVTPLVRDGALGHPETAPYQRIIATVGAGDIPPAWPDQLAPDGLLLVPLRIRGGVSRSIGFVRDQSEGVEHWHATSHEMCTFMPLRGIADDARRVIPLTDDGQVSLHTYRDQHIDSDALATVLRQPATEIYTGVIFRKGDPWEFTNLYLACALPGGIVRMPADGPAVRSGLVRPQFPWGAMAAVDGDSVAYLTLRAGHDDEGPYWEGGLIGHGLRGGELAAQVAEHLRVWGHEYRDTKPTIRMARGEHRASLTGQFVIDKPHVRLAIDWN
ncbi:methyltransferase, FxLD system [Spongiactinospora gelatinilytica]|uniref:Protein-L-isoaspartate O-methyltransferase n=1 Tax=Spongiactinospora gelatinilytica TaxID=2666298 RepID=A0A2W2HXU3_9ACTN|nr:methyltransferase, FxLD system [Spongiactinospora gelatinilytica]